MNKTKNNILDKISWTILAALFAVSVYFYQHFPLLVPIHWNASGGIDGYGSPGFAAFFLPILSIGIYVLLTYLPRIDPYHERYKEFAGSYSILKLCVVVFMSAIHVFISINGLGYALDVAALIQALVGLLFLVLGLLLPNIKRNWFVGIRTPWTLSDEVIWDKTHKFGGVTFSIAGFIALFLPLVSSGQFFGIFIGALIAAGLLPVLYSYILYTQKPKKG